MTRSVVEHLKYEIRFLSARCKSAKEWSAGDGHNFMKGVCSLVGAREVQERQWPKPDERPEAETMQANPSDSHDQRARERGFGSDVRAGLR